MKLRLRAKSLFRKKNVATNVATPEGAADSVAFSSTSSAVTRRPMHRMFFNADILATICVLLDATLDRLSLCATSRWFNVVLKYTVHTKTILRPEGPTIDLLNLLLREPSRCGSIVYLEVWLSLRSRFYVPGRDDLAQLWRQREEYIQGVQTVLERAPNLKRLYLKFEHGEQSLAHDLSFERRVFPFKLQSCRLAGPALGGLDLVNSQSGITHLVLSEKSQQHPSQIPDRAQGFTSSNNLRSLWATPGWACALLLRSPVRTFGLIRDSRKLLLGWGWNGDLIVFNQMADMFAKMGGHPSVKCLALPAREFYFVDSLMELKTVSDGFPNVEKLGITLEPREYDEADEYLITYVRAQIKYAEREGPIFQSVREFSFLLPEMWPHEQFYDGPPYSLDTLELLDDNDFEIPVELLKIMPRLAHVDTLERCYSRLGSGASGCDPYQVFGSDIGKGGCDEGVRSVDNVWFGRPRSECCLSDDWSKF